MKVTQDGEPSNPLPVKCCDKFISEIKADNILCVMIVSPFSSWSSWVTGVPINTPPTVYIQSDGGHGGLEAISYCPFCGTKIQFKG